MQAKPSFKYFIIVFSLIVGVWSVYNDLIWTTHDFKIGDLKQLFSPLNLQLSFGSKAVGRVNGLNQVNGIFDFLLILGAIGFAINGERQIRLLRFVYSLIFGCNVVSILRLVLFFVLFRPMMGNKAPVITTDRMIGDAEFLAMECAWLVVSFLILRYFNRTRDVAVELHEQEDGEQVGIYIEASKGTRFMHNLIDNLTIILIFSDLQKTFEGLVSHGASAANSNEDVGTVLLTQVFFLVCAWIYFAIYEAIFGITPAKTLTGTRVVDDESRTPQFKTIAIRSLSRLVPFDSISFFMDRGWHDKWSDTYVVMEEIVETDEQISTPQA
ncbi:RDD family protein [Mucilaginibacter yixingensis]|uniref:RDD family protein n=1 Tax=Mucilaginibacter yixingensis TaxID=1295612 RepID=A0A2T5JDT2_9SPHI|nr:RDD family protein [Mucilaginibacter yixingensis]PTQ99924.1 RDD family protein [Mucilaginibacter yixingensis]